MAITLTGAVTGVAVTGLTSPTYTLSADTPPESNAKQGAVTALGGTQTGVTAHSLASPFTSTYIRPRQFNLTANTAAGKTQYNNHRFTTRKGMTVDYVSTVKVGSLRSDFAIPVGAEAVDIVNIKAMLSAHIGLLTQEVNNVILAISSGVI